MQPELSVSCMGVNQYYRCIIQPNVICVTCVIEQNSLSWKKTQLLFIIWKFLITRKYDVKWISGLQILLCNLFHLPFGSGITWYTNPFFVKWPSDCNVMVIGLDVETRTSLSLFFPQWDWRIIPLASKPENSCCKNHLMSLQRMTNELGIHSFLHLLYSICKHTVFNV